MSGINWHTPPASLPISGRIPWISIEEKSHSLLLAITLYICLRYSSPAIEHNATCYNYINVMMKLSTESMNEDAVL